jgi:hypothetical protein
VVIDPQSAEVDPEDCPWSNWIGPVKVAPAGREKQQVARLQLPILIVERAGSIARNTSDQNVLGSAAGTFHEMRSGCHEGADMGDTEIACDGSVRSPDGNGRGNDD